VSDSNARACATASRFYRLDLKGLASGAPPSLCHSKSRTLGTIHLQSDIGLSYSPMVLISATQAAVHAEEIWKGVKICSRCENSRVEDDSTHSLRTQNSNASTSNAVRYRTLRLKRFETTQPSH
jgi:hypothetical protein